MDAGRYWAEIRSGAGKDELDSDAEWLGIDLPENTEPDGFGVLPENWNALLQFLKCSTQWRIIAGMGGAFYQGLDYPSVDIVLSRSGLSPEEQNKVFGDIQTIERGALEVINEKD